MTSADAIKFFELCGQTAKLCIPADAQRALYPDDAEGELNDEAILALGPRGGFGGAFKRAIQGLGAPKTFKFICGIVREAALWTSPS